MTSPKSNPGSRETAMKMALEYASAAPGITPRELVSAAAEIEKFLLNGALEEDKKDEGHADAA